MKSQRETRNGLPEIGEKVILSTKELRTALNSVHALGLYGVLFL